MYKYEKLVKRIELLLYSPFKNSKNTWFGLNVTWHDAYCQQHNGILKLYLFSITKFDIKYGRNRQSNQSKIIKIASI